MQNLDFMKVPHFHLKRLFPIYPIQKTALSVHFIQVVFNSCYCNFIALIWYHFLCRDDLSVIYFNCLYCTMCMYYLSGGITGTIKINNMNYINKVVALIFSFFFLGIFSGCENISSPSSPLSSPPAPSISTPIKNPISPLPPSSPPIPSQIDIPDSEKITIVTSFYPLADFAKEVGGKRVLIRNLVPAGAEPHDYEPTPQDMASLEEADLFIINGASFESWTDRVKENLRGKKIRIIDMSSFVPLIESHSLEKETQTAENSPSVTPPSSFDNEGEVHESGPTDPHFWLSPKIAIQEVEVIQNNLVALDPRGVTTYLENGKTFTQALKTLDQKYSSGLKNCTSREFVTTHTAFAYLAKEYNLHQIAIAGLSPDQEPSPQQLADIAKQSEEKKIKYIFFETLVSPKLAQTIAEEVGAGTLVLNPIEGLTDQEIAEGKNYISVMEENLNHLRFGLECP